MTHLKMQGCFPLMLGALALFLTGCSTPKMGEHKYVATQPVYVAPAPKSTGAIYQASTSMSLFEDIKAKRVGDILTIVLNERTNAEKKADTTVDKSSETGIGVPKLFGQTVPELENSISAGHKFETEGDSKQSNKLEGSITVTVARVLSNGNLVVQGEKWITLNQGSEYVRFRGIIRPTDIDPRNTISSTRVANAEIIYGGDGAVADSSSMGWLTRFFNSSWMPF